MAFRHGMVQCRVAGDVGRIQRGLVLQEQVDHRNRAYSSGAVQRVLAALVPCSRSRGRLPIEKLSGHLEVVLGRYEMHGGLEESQSPYNPTN